MALSGAEQGIWLVATPASLNFGNQAVGSTSTPQTITLTNYGDGYSATVSPVINNPPFNFSQGTCTSPLAAATSATAPGGSCQFTISYSPTTTATYTNTQLSVTATYAFGVQPIFISVSGTGTAPTAAVETLSPTSLNFANVTIGTTSAPQPVTVTNTGTAQLSGIVPTLGGANASQYAISSSNCPGGLAPSASCVINITYTPAGSASSSASLSVATNAGNSPQSVLLSGTGTAALVPQATLSPGSLSFPSTTVGVAATPLPVTLSNPGTGPLSINSIGITSLGAGIFGETNTCGSSLAAGASCTINVSFTPTGPNLFAGTLTVSDNAAVSVQSITIGGSGAAVLVPQATLNPTTLTFPGTTVGVAATSLPITLSNPGTGALAITSISVTGTNSSSFGQTNTCGSSLAAGASCTITVSFTPASAGSLGAAISVVDNASGSPQSIAIGGTGSAVVTGGTTFTVTSSTPSASVQSGGVAQFNLLIAPVGGSYSNVVTLSAAGLPAGALPSFLPPSVTPGSAGAPSVLSIQTSTGLARLAAPERRGQSSIPMLALLAGLPLLGLAGATRRLRRSAGRWMLLCLAVLSVLPLLALSGCGGGYFGHTPQTYTVTVTGTSGALQQTTTVSLTVQ